MVADCRSVQDPEDCRRTESPAGNPCDVYEVRHVNVADCSPAGATGTASPCVEVLPSGSTTDGCISPVPNLNYRLLGDGTAYLLTKPTCFADGPSLENQCTYLGSPFPQSALDWSWEPSACGCGGPPPGWPY
jgi:hypothetical protein